MAWACDKCGAEAVLSGKVRPLAEVWGPNNHPWKPDGKCEVCGEVGYVANHPGIKARHDESSSFSSC